jgi:hypothetical protein
MKLLMSATVCFMAQVWGDGLVGYTLIALAWAFFIAFLLGVKPYAKSNSQ